MADDSGRPGSFMGGTGMGWARWLVRHGPFAAFFLACLIIAFLFGFRTAEHQSAPFQFVEGVGKTLDVISEHFRARYNDGFVGYSQVPVKDIAGHRVQRLAGGGDEAFLLTGGPQQYLDACPGAGCLAVVLDRGGKLVRAYPFRPSEFRKGDLVNLPYQQPFNTPALDLNPFGLLALPGGDLIVTFSNAKAFPYGAGVARVRPDGHPVWFRRDYTNHWPALLPSGEIALTSARISTRPQFTELVPHHWFSAGCRIGYYRDTILMIGPDGKQRAEYQLLDAILASPWKTLLIPLNDEAWRKSVSCDPLHTNFIRAVGPEIAARLPGVKPDDLLVSMRNISAIGIFDRRTQRFTHMFRGSFHLQHSAQPVPGGKIVVFDDMGSSGTVGPSRVMVLDPATGQETTVFPGPQSPPGLSFVSKLAGNIDLSADGKRLLLAIPEDPFGYEVELATGKALTRFEDLHDLRSLKLEKDRKADFAARFKQSAIYYWPRVELPRKGG